MRLGGQREGWWDVVTGAEKRPEEEGPALKAFLEKNRKATYLALHLGDRHCLPNMQALHFTSAVLEFLTSKFVTMWVLVFAMWTIFDTAIWPKSLCHTLWSTESAVFSSPVLGWMIPYILDVFFWTTATVLLAHMHACDLSAPVFLCYAELRSSSCLLKCVLWYVQPQLHFCPLQHSSL